MLLARLSDLSLLLSNREFGLSCSISLWLRRFCRLLDHWPRLWHWLLELRGRRFEDRLLFWLRLLFGCRAFELGSGLMIGMSGMRSSGSSLFRTGVFSTSNMFSMSRVLGREHGPGRLACYCLLASMPELQRNCPRAGLSASI